MAKLSNVRTCHQERAETVLYYLQVAKKVPVSAEWTQKFLKMGKAQFFIWYTPQKYEFDQECKHQGTKIHGLGGWGVGFSFFWARNWRNLALLDYEFTMYKKKKRKESKQNKHKN
jgi:hypothetical protein